MRRVSRSALGEVSLLPPAFKSDPGAQGVRRARQCCCGRAPGRPAFLAQVLRPACAVPNQVAFAQEEFRRARFP
eukprot:7614327-Lingulodinium_polyedra.AAC.1